MALTPPLAYMSVEVAKRYFELADSPAATLDDLLELFAPDAVVIEPHVGRYEGHDGIRDFFAELGDIFSEGVHEIEQYHQDGNTVVCEGTITGETVVGNSYAGVGVSEIMEFDDTDRIQSFRVYVDYSGILSELPDSVPDYRNLWN